MKTSRLASWVIRESGLGFGGNPESQIKPLRLAMKTTLRTLSSSCAVLLLAGTLTSAKAATYTVDPGASWLGYINVFNVGGPGYGMAGAGGSVFGSGWGTADLRANFSGPVLSLQANTVGDPNPFWYTPSGGPGAVGNKIIDANFYQEFN